MATKLNVNIRTLLTNCEELAKDESNFWRLKKYIKALETMMEELRIEEADKSTTKIPHYEKRLNAIKVAINYVESPLPSKSRLAKVNSHKESMGDDVLNEVRQLKASKNYNDLRKELMNDDSLRRRRADDSSTVSENMNEAVRFHNQTQEKITEHMLALTRSLKEQTVTANRIIKKDTEVVSKSTGMTDNNISSLHKETEKLENHSKNAWKCWMWMMIMFVIVTFIAMVLFMKIMKKRKT